MIKISQKKIFKNLHARGTKTRVCEIPKTRVFPGGSEVGIFLLTRAQVRARAKIFCETNLDIGLRAQKSLGGARARVQFKLF